MRVAQSAGKHGIAQEDALSMQHLGRSELNHLMMKMNPNGASSYVA
jgi:hypothetical protein